MRQTIGYKVTATAPATIMKTDEETLVHSQSPCATTETTTTMSVTMISREHPNSCRQCSQCHREGQAHHRSPFSWLRGCSTRATIRTFMAVMLLANLQTCLSLSSSTPASTVQPPVLEHQDLRGSLNVLAESDWRKMYYRYLTIQKTSPTSPERLYVGAMEYIYRADITDISQYTKSSNVSQLNQATNPVPEVLNNNVFLCTRKGKSLDFQCKNHIRAIIMLDDRRIQLCGTAAFSPQDIYLDQKLHVSQYGEINSGDAKCPCDPDVNSPVLYVKTGNAYSLPSIYSSTIMDSQGSKPVINRSPAGSRGEDHAEDLRTVDDEKWLNEPNFVGSFDVGKYVYTFFRETALEYQGYGHTVFSRVSRVCKDDKGGGSSVMENKWTSFLKARLNCSLPGDYPFYFDHIRDVTIVEQDNVFFGVFTNSFAESGPYMSAVCEFSVAAINKVFDEGTFMEQIESSGFWQPVPPERVPLSTRPGQCQNDSKAIPNDVLQFAKTRRLMHNVTDSQNQRPLLYRTDVEYRKMAVDRVDGYVRVFFLASNTSEIHKVVTWQDGRVMHSKLLAVWKPLTYPTETIWQMKLHNRKLYIATDREVVQAPVQMCQLYSSCTDCIQDPYCQWSNHRCGDATSKDMSHVKAGDPVKVCGSSCTKISPAVTVRVQGDPVHFNCNSWCKASSGSVSWHLYDQGLHQFNKLTIDNQKYFLTGDQGLIVFNVSKMADVGRYQCLSSGVVLAEVTLNKTDCLANGSEACWREEFRNWCKEFDSYKQQFNHWKCLKNECVGGSQCIPSAVSGKCVSPEG